MELNHEVAYVFLSEKQIKFPETIVHSFINFDDL